MQLMDCFSELIAYTELLIPQLQSNNPPTYETVKSVYKLLIERAEASAGSGNILPHFSKGSFPVYAWIDEQILSADWPYKTEWLHQTLQKTLFQTNNAGNEFFSRLGSLKQDDTMVLEVYAICLLKGFKGELYRPHDRDKLLTVQKQTMKQLSGSKDPVFPDPLFPEAVPKAASGRTFKPKKWQGQSLFSPVILLLPILLCIGLFFFFDQTLDQMVKGLSILPL